MKPDRRSADPGQVTEHDVVRGPATLGLNQDSVVVVHSSLRSIGRVTGGAEAVVRAPGPTCATVLVPSGTWDPVGVPPPPGLDRPNNARATLGGVRRRLSGALADQSGLPIDRAPCRREEGETPPPRRPPAGMLTPELTVPEVLDPRGRPSPLHAVLRQRAEFFPSRRGVAQTSGSAS